MDHAAVVGMQGAYDTLKMFQAPDRDQPSAAQCAALVERVQRYDATLPDIVADFVVGFNGELDVTEAAVREMRAAMQATKA